MALELEELKPEVKTVKIPREMLSKIVSRVRSIELPGQVSVGIFVDKETGEAKAFAVAYGAGWFVPWHGETVFMLYFKTPAKFVGWDDIINQLKRYGVEVKIISKKKE